MFRIFQLIFFKYLLNSFQIALFVLFILYLKHLSNVIKSLYMIFKLYFNFIIIIFRYASKYIIYNF